MMFEQIEKAKSDYTDKYVALVGDLPQYARFAGLVGRVKTVNMSGRALVEWLHHNEDIGWYDIDLDYLKVVEKPVELEPEKPKAAAKPAAKKKPAGLSPLEQLRQKGGAKPKKPTAPAKPQAAGLSPLEQLRQQGGTKKKEATEDDQQQDAKPKAKLSPLEILRQQGGATKQESADEDTPQDAKAKAKLSPIEILRQQGGTKKKDK